MEKTPKMLEIEAKYGMPLERLLRENYERIRSTVKVGEKYDVCSSIGRWMKEEGIKIGKKPSKEELEEKCKELGYNASRVGEFYKVSYGTVWGWIKGYGIKTNKSTQQISLDLTGLLISYAKSQ